MVEEWKQGRESVGCLHGNKDSSLKYCRAGSFAGKKLKHLFILLL